MKVAHISSQETWRGGEQQIYYLHGELLNQGINSVVIAKNESAIAKRLIKEGLPCETYPFKSAYDLFTAWKIKSYVSNNHIDIVHAHTAKAHTLVILAVMLGMRTRIVVSRRVDVPVKDNWFSKYKYNHPSVQKIICVSEKIRSITARGIKNQTVLETVYSGVDLERFQNSKHGKLREAFNIPKNQILIGNISALADHKDYPTFLSTANKVLQQKPNVTFMIVGDGEEKEPIEHYIQSQNLQKHIQLTGFRSDIPEVLADFDIFLFTSKTEGLGTTAIDALASGTPVIATKAGGVPEIIQQNECGILVDVGDADQLAMHCIELIEDESERAEFSRRGLKTAKNFSKKLTAEKTLKIYNSLL